MKPVPVSRITQPFADPGSYASVADSHGPAGHHTGIDFGSRWPIPIAGRLVRAALPGEVVISEYNDTMGNWVGVYNRDRNLLVTYWHMKVRKVRVGDWVTVYQPLGKVGTTGNSTAPHLHLQANAGREFDYHGHVHPWGAIEAYTLKTAKKAWRLAKRRRRRERLR